mmetsp:Transcript_23873/g.73506  ORF Transcript_23873/g.73506 Transcript_23873/m.73506 type:complete len:248 (-) Transcript_23873:744-1487(-)
MSWSMSPKKRGPTAVAQTRSATRKSGMISKRSEAWTTAATLKPITTRRDQFGESRCLTRSCDSTAANPFCRVSTDDAAKVVKSASVRKCQTRGSGSNRSKKARYASFWKDAYASGSLASAIMPITPKNIMTNVTANAPSRKPRRKSWSVFAAKTRCHVPWLKSSAEDMAMYNVTRASNPFENQPVASSNSDLDTSFLFRVVVAKSSTTTTAAITTPCSLSVNIDAGSPPMAVYDHVANATAMATRVV